MQYQGTASSFKTSVFWPIRWLSMQPLHSAVLMCTHCTVWYCGTQVMNSADPIHFDTLHAPLPLPVLDKLFTAKHTITQVYGEGKRCV